MSNLNKLTIKEMSKGLRNRDFSSSELLESHIAAIESQNGEINAFVSKIYDYARKAAVQADSKIASGGDLHPLLGVPIGVKDNFCTKGFSTTACSKILSGFVPPYESTVTQNLLDAGAIFVGKTNMDEMAMGSANSHSYYGEALNPWRGKDDPNKKLVPGGSSGGSAAAVSSYMVPAALGSDTGGSVRQPGALCGVVGLKPTYGMCSRWGMIAFASSLDQAGVFARSVNDAALVLECISGYDEKDSTSKRKADDVKKDLSVGIDGNIKGRVVGVPKEIVESDMSDDVRKEWERNISLCESLGAEVKYISIKDIANSLPVYYVLSSAEASSNLSRYDGVRYGFRDEQESLEDMYSVTRDKGFGYEVKRRIFMGTYVLSSGHYDALYCKAQLVRKKLLTEFLEVFNMVDAILIPTTPSEAFGFHDKSEEGVEMYCNDIFTVPASLAGFPAVSVPTALSSNGLPLGMQLIGPHFCEKTILNFAAAIEKDLCSMRV